MNDSVQQCRLYVSITDPFLFKLKVSSIYYHLKSLYFQAFSRSPNSQIFPVLMYYDTIDIYEHHCVDILGLHQKSKSRYRGAAAPWCRYLNIRISGAGEGKSWIHGARAPRYRGGHKMDWWCSCTAVKRSAKAGSAVQLHCGEREGKSRISGAAESRCREGQKPDLRCSAPR